MGIWAALLLCVLMAGCATIPAEECARVNWYALGFEDGLKGYTADRIAKHREACAAVNVIPDERAYYSGRAEGLHEYCKQENAFVEGLAGREYRGVCPPPVDRVSATTAPPMRCSRSGTISGVSRTGSTARRRSCERKTGMTVNERNCGTRYGHLTKSAKTYGMRSTASKRSSIGCVGTGSVGVQT